MPLDRVLCSPGKTSCPVCSFHTTDTSRPALDTRLLSSNDPPAFTEALTLKSNLLDLRRTLSQAEDLMNTMRDAIHDIEIVLNPVRSLPQDILATIFEWCMTLWDDVVVSYEEYDSIGPRNPMWTLSYVCCRWRDIILASPRMWSFICLDMYEYKGILLARLLSKLGLQIQRSGNVEMDVALFDAPENDDYHPSCVLEPLLYSTTRRWRSFHIKGAYSTFDSFMGYPFDKLTHVTIGVYDNAKSTDRAITCFRQAPYIQHVETNYPNVELLWDGVASYHCNSAGLTNIPQMAASLRRLTVSCGTSADQWQLAAPFILSALTRLHILAYSSSSSTQSLPTDMLITPALHTLCLEYRHSIRVPFPKFRQSPTCLENISVIQAGNIRVAEFITFLGETVCVTALFLDSFATTDEVLTALRPKTEETLSLLPQLKSLRFGSMTIQEHCDGVIALVDSRPGIEELWVVGDLDKDWREDERDPGAADRWRDFCSRTRVIHVLENDF